MKFQEFRRLCMSQPEAEERKTWGEVTFRVRGRIFAIGSPEGHSVSLKASLDDQAGLVAMDPRTFAVSAYTGRFGWVTVRLTRVAPPLAERLIRNAWERTAPRRLVAQDDEVRKRGDGRRDVRPRAVARSAKAPPRR